ncbi:MAG TPA: O-antigen ligase family protein [Candidatus Limnocylindria bacterium]
MTRSILVAGAAALWALGFIGFFGTYITTFDPTLRLVAALVYGVPAVAGAIVALAIRPHPLDIPVLAVIAAYALVSALSVDSTASLETLALATAYGSLFLLLLRVGRGPLRQGLVIGAAFAASAWLAFTAIAWLQDAVTWVALDGSIPPLAARSGGLWLSTDAIAALALLAAPLYLQIERASTRNVLAAVAALGAIIVIPLSGGRVEWVAILVAASVYYLTSGRRSWSRLRRPILIALGVAAVAGIGLFMTGWLGTLSGRTFIWQTALAVIARHPLDGAGPGTFSWVRLAESPELLNRYPVYHAHNLVLQVLADGGVLLLAAIAALSVVYVRHVARGTVPMTPAHRAGIGSLAGFAAILMMDELTQVPALTALAIGSATFIAHDRSFRPASMRAPILRAIPALGCLLLVLVALPAVLNAHQARVAAAVGRERAVAGDWEGAERDFTAAAAAWPMRASYELALGLADAQLGREEDARAHYERANALSPGDPRALGALGVLGTTHAERADALGRASRLGSLDSQYGYRLALELLSTGDRGLATEELGRAALLDPQLLVASDIVGLRLDVEEVAAAVRRALDVEGPLAVVDPTTSEAAIEVALARVPVKDDTMAAIALARSGQLSGARAMLAEILRAEPRDRAARIAARETSGLACDPAAEARHDRLLGLLPGGYTALYLAGPGVRETRDHVYREMGLGDYQPPQAQPLPVYGYEWPAGYLPPTRCPQQP